MTEFTSALKIMKSMDCRLKTYRKRDEVLAKSTEKRFKYLIKYQTKLSLSKFGTVYFWQSPTSCSQE
jgi:hypothetical protein